MRLPIGIAGKGPLLALCMGLLSGLAMAQQEIPLWPAGAPQATGSTANDKPGLTPYPASQPNGAAVLVFPGGGYTYLESTKEGSAEAKWLQGQGISAFVVRYRFSPYRHPVEMRDAQRAVRWVRAHAKEYGIDTSRVGVMGFSAGGHLASTVSTHYDGGNPSATDSVDRHGCRPAFSILGYPVITMDSAFTHLDSRKSLLGANPSQAMIDSLSNEKQVTAKTPPAFLFHATNDGLVPIRNSQAYYDSLVKRGVPAAFMKFDHGGHGFAMADGKWGAITDTALHKWCDSSLKWLDQRGFLSKPSSLAPEAARGP